MSFYFNGSQANVTISGGINTKIPLIDTTTQTYLAPEITTTGAAQTAYTVPAGKRAFLLGVQCVSGIADAGELTIVDEDTGEWIGKFQKVANVASTLQSFNYVSYCFMRTAGQIIKISGTNARIWAFYILEEDV